jgi:hypothetical protein
MIRKARPKISHGILARTLSLLQRGTVTPYTISTECGVHLTTAQAWLRTLYEEHTIHISGWIPDTLGRDVTPVYSLGAGDDTPRKRKTRSQIMKEYRQRKKELTA